MDAENARDPTAQPGSSNTDTGIAHGDGLRRSRFCLQLAKP